MIHAVRKFHLQIHVLMNSDSVAHMRAMHPRGTGNDSKVYGKHSVTLSHTVKKQFPFVSFDPTYIKKRHSTWGGRLQHLLNEQASLRTTGRPRPARPQASAGFSI